MIQNLADELKLMLANDQDDLRKYREKKLSKKEFLVTTSARSRRFKRMLNDGFPNTFRVGRGGYEAGVAIVLHSGDTGLMRTYLKQHQEQSEKTVDIAHRAFLIDKILIAEGKRQRYGTQFKRIVDGKVDFLPLESPELVDKKRKDLLLPTLFEYEQIILNASDSR